MMAAAKTIAQNGLMYRAALAEVKESGFYKITLSPQVLARCQCSLADLRIINTGKQVSCIISLDAYQFIESNFIEYPFVSKLKEANKQTRITIQNKTGKDISDLLLVTTDMRAKRFANISGSNNLKECFIVKEGVARIIISAL